MKVRWEASQSRPQQLKSKALRNSEREREREREIERERGSERTLRKEQDKERHAERAREGAKKIVWMCRCGSSIQHPCSICASEGNPVSIFIASCLQAGGQNQVHHRSLRRRQLRINLRLRLWLRVSSCVAAPKLRHRCMRHKGFGLRFKGFGLRFNGLNTCTYGVTAWNFGWHLGLCVSGLGIEGLGVRACLGISGL